MKEFLDYAQAHSDEILSSLREMVEIESFSSDHAGVNRLAAYLRDAMEAVGARVMPIPQTEAGDHFLADVGDGEEQVLVLCHMDTVWPQGTLQDKPFRIENGLAYGPGILDMKAGIAIGLHAVKALRSLEVSPQQRVRFLFNSDEELGSTTSRQIIEEESRKSTHVFCLEPSAGSGGALKLARKGVGMFQVRVTGRAAHAGNEPEKGISAVEELAHHIIRLHSLTDHSVGTTVNVGVVHGGTVRNQVAAYAEAVIDLRVATMAEAERVTEEINALSPVLPGARVDVTGGLNRPPMEQTEGTSRLFETAQSLAQPLGITLTGIQVGGGSDAQFAAAVGVPVLDGLGGVGEGPHADHEHIQVECLPQRVALLASLLAGR